MMHSDASFSCAQGPSWVVHLAEMRLHVHVGSINKLNLNDLTEYHRIATDKRTFNYQAIAHQFGELQAVESKNVVEDDGPEVDSVEHRSDPSRHGLTHKILQSNETERQNQSHDFRLFSSLGGDRFNGYSAILELTSMLEKGRMEKNLATHSSKLRPKQLKKDQM